jgi:hypothetical protein
MPGGGWYPLEGYNFSSITALGIYFIWCDGNPSTNVRAGQGIVGARITVHKSDPEIMRHRVKGTNARHMGRGTGDVFGSD